MNTQIHYNLGGSFKADLYNKDGFISGTEWFSNFITPTGLMMPLNYAFADCFRYLSLGRSSANHSGATTLGQVGTTGLIDPISSYTITDGSTQNAQYIDWRAYASGTSQSNCGTVISETGPHFYRAWRIPSGGDENFIQETAGGGLTIAELMVSPGSGSDLTGKYAFSRVHRNLFIPNGYSVIISYQLRINIQNTGVTTFGAGSFATGDAEVSNDAALVATWANLSGYYRQVYNGLRYVDAIGMTYVPKYGDCMEPSSRNLSRALWYLSPDNSQFDVSVSGGNQSSIAAAYQADGLAKTLAGFETTDIVAYTTTPANYQTAFNNNTPDLSNKPADLTDGTLDRNLRIGRSSVSNYKPPLVDNYKNASTVFNYQVKASPESQNVSYATPGVNGFSTSYSDFGKKAVLTSAITKLPIVMTGQNLITGRKKTVTRRAIFSPVSSMGYNTRFGSMVFAYSHPDATTIGDKLYYPMIDCLFYDSSGRALMPHYRFITGIQLTERGTGILDGNLYLSGGAGGNIYQFAPRSTFQGDYESPLSHPRLTDLAWSGIGNNLKYSGFAATGTLNSNAYGSTGVLNNISGLGSTLSNYSNGWGAIYGVVVNSGFYDLKYDIGLADHSLSSLVDPGTTGQLYWNSITAPNKITLYHSGLKYYHPDLGFSFTDTGWFSPSHQVVKKIDFEAVASGVWGTSISNSLNPSFVKNVTGVANQPAYVGYFLTSKQFSGTVVNPATDTFLPSEAICTGYIIPPSVITTNQLHGTAWISTVLGVPSPNYSFIPRTSGFTLNGTECQKVYSLFTGITDRGFPNGTGEPIPANTPLNVFFTGISIYNQPVYLTYISGVASTANLTGYSFMSGTVYTTDFCAPAGYPTHVENSGAYGWMLSPNFNEPAYYPTDFTSVNFGGEYPATSLDNALEIYLNLSWSSLCGNSVTNCLDPVPGSP